MVVLVIERQEGVETKLIRTSYVRLGFTISFFFKPYLIPLVDGCGDCLRDFRQRESPVRKHSWSRKRWSKSDPEQLQPRTVRLEAVFFVSRFSKTLYRWGMACASVSAQRAVVEECLKYV